MKVWMTTVVGAALLFAGQAMADDVDAKAAETFAKKYACLTCHATDKKLVGPAYKEVAKKYKGDKAAKDKLIAKVKKGGSGVWGAIPMPPNGSIKPEELETIVKWVLSL